MPAGTALPKVQATRDYGAQVTFAGHTVDEAIAAAEEYAQAEGAVLIHPFDHPEVIAGQGTVGLEILRQCPEVRTVLVATGGGGLLSGIAGLIVIAINSSSDANLVGLGMELDAIAAVVIGGTLLTGGSGYVVGTLFGVLIYGTIQTIISFHGELSSWWTKIVIGLLLLAFCLLQQVFARTRGLEATVRRRRSPPDSQR
jgi:hypothetical protein